MGPSSEKEQLVDSWLRDFKVDCSVSNQAPVSIQLATRHIHERLFDRELTVKDLRAELGLTDSTFSVRFRHHHGRTPASYIRHLRVEAAKQLLCRYDELRIADVALYVGYEHYRTFNRVFKRVTGETPRAFRKRAGSP